MAKTKIPLGLIGLEDTFREGAREVITKLKEYGIETIMLTGNNERTAKAVSDELGIYRCIVNVLPEQKLNEIKDLQEEALLTMIGDGVNHTPSLIKSDVGIAIGAAGPDTGMESADMALMDDGLTRLIYLFDISEKP